VDDDKTGRAPVAVDVGSVDLPMSGDFMANSLLHFGVTGDRESKVWIFRDDVPSKFPRAGFCAGDDDFRIEVIDLFRGRHPLLINHEAVPAIFLELEKMGVPPLLASFARNGL
jgi:hypothetical protein